MGLELLNAELEECDESNKAGTGAKTGSTAGKPATSSAKNASSSQESDYASGISFCRQVTKDTIENVQCAVEILNDLLSYDKISSGTLKLEVGVVPIAKLLEKNVHQFKVQAANRRVKLSLSILDAPEKNLNGKSDVEEAPGVRERSIYVIGDDVRLGQCIRNVISKYVLTIRQYCMFSQKTTVLTSWFSFQCFENLLPVVVPLK